MPLHDLNQAQLRTLRALAKYRRPVPVAELAEDVGASRGTVGSQVRRLLDEGLARAISRTGGEIHPDRISPLRDQLAGYRAIDEIRYLVTGR